MIWRELESKVGTWGAPCFLVGSKAFQLHASSRGDALADDCGAFGKIRG